MKWIFKIKHKQDKSIKRCTIKLVTYRYEQRRGINYDKIFASVAKTETIISSIFNCMCERKITYLLNEYNYAILSI